MSQDTKAQIIEIDCVPGNLRPGHIMETLLKQAANLPEYKPPVNTFFGCWTWDFTDLTAKEWKALQDVAGPFLTAQYGKGNCRYASW